MAGSIPSGRRGSASNPGNRFDAVHRAGPGPFQPQAVGDDACPDGWDPELDPDPDDLLPATRLIDDHSVSILSTNDSPDVGFTHSINPYRGCEHGCSYCYARPTHEYLGYSAGLDFESRILVKREAPRLLREALQRPSWSPTPIALSGVTDCYQPIESRLRLTRGCLEVLAESRNPTCLITKNRLVVRDIDLLSVLARHEAVSVHVSITTLDPTLRSVMEPRTSPPAGRLAAIRALSAAGIPVGVLVAPIIPGINDPEVPAILSAAAAAGARYASYTVLRLPGAVEPLFLEWLRRHFPDREEKVLGRLRSLRDGELSSAAFGERMRGQGLWADHFRRLFEVAARRVGLSRRAPALSVTSFRRPGDPSQPELDLG